MTKKDYVRIASVFNRTFNDVSSGNSESSRAMVWAIDFLADRLADTLAEDNARFNRMRFLESCGCPTRI